MWTASTEQTRWTVVRKYTINITFDEQQCFYYCDPLFECSPQLNRAKNCKMCHDTCLFTTRIGSKYVTLYMYGVVMWWLTYFVCAYNCAPQVSKNPSRRCMVF